MRIGLRQNVRKDVRRICGLVVLSDRRPVPTDLYEHVLLATFLALADVLFDNDSFAFRQRRVLDERKFLERIDLSRFPTSQRLFSKLKYLVGIHVARNDQG